MADLVIETRRLSYHMHGVALVDDVNMRVGAGEFLGIVGPNGAGKTSLLGLLSGEIRPTSGTASISGHTVSGGDLGELASLRSMLTQREPLDIPYTVRQIVEMGLHPHVRRGAVSAGLVRDVMSLTEITHLATRVYRTLSRGEQTRVSLARVIAQDTPVVLLDEPTNALDLGHQERIMRRLADLARGGKTVVAVLHDLNSAASHVDRLAVMSQGRVIADGTPRDVLTSVMLSSVYRQPITVVDHPLSDRPWVLTV